MCFCFSAKEKARGLKKFTPEIHDTQKQVLKYSKLYKSAFFDGTHFLFIKFGF
jgi:hypothetical protein